MTISKIGSRLLPGRGGFTLIEVLMAVSILAVGMVGGLRAYSTSVTAMEIAQYNIDAAYLLKAVMGDVEEKSIFRRGTSVGAAKEVYASSSDIKIDTTRPGKWQWDEEVLATDLQVFKSPKGTSATASAATSGTVTVSEKILEEQVAYFLNEVKITVVNPGRSPARKVSVVTYMESDSA